MSYDAFAETFSNSRKNLKWAEMEAILEDIKNISPARVLDIGCGNGRFLTEAKLHGIIFENYLGVDNSSGMVKEAQKLEPDADFRVIPMESLSGISGGKTYNIIVFLASFHHLKTPEERKKVLHDLHSLLTDDGTIYMTNWNLLEQQKYQKSHRGNGDFDIKIGEHSRYYHGFTQDELQELFEDTGWHAIEHRIFDGGRNIFSRLKK